MQPQPLASRLPIFPTLQQWSEQGCPVDCGTPWSREALIEALKYGNHPSAETPEAHALIESEVEYQVQAGFGKIMYLQQ
jgi:hypothetical protein